jgi:hypothetical protein
MAEKSPEYLASIQDNIQRWHRCESRYVKTETLALPGDVGDVEIFTLLNHPDAKRCYVFCDKIRPGEMVIVLGVTGLDSPEGAVSLWHQRRAEGFMDALQLLQAAFPDIFKSRKIQPNFADEPGLSRLLDELVAMTDPQLAEEYVARR